MMKIAITTVLILIVVGGGYWYWKNQQPKVTDWIELRSLSFTQSADADLTAQTASGQVEGKRYFNGTIDFQGIPFAQPPVGDLRYAAPVPVEAWDGVLEAKEPAPRCIQAPSFFEDWGGVQSEDCLWLNVTTPNLDGEKRPVMVWIHGGGLYSGSAGEPTYEGANLVDRGDVVLVTLQYRLGTFGFLDLPDVEGSGRAGYEDQLLGLRWVKENIASFGGDPDNITIFGESAGSYGTFALATNPEAKDLFDKVILMSGAYNPETHRMPRSEGVALIMDHLGAKSAADLRAYSPLELLDAQNALIEIAGKEGADLQILIEPPRPGIEQLNALAGLGKPMLQGVTSHEARFFLSVSGADGPTFAKGFLKGFNFTEKEVDQLAAVIGAHEPDMDESELYAHLVSAQQFIYPQNEVVTEYLTRNPQVYSYIFDGAWPGAEELRGAHSVDLNFTFNTVDKLDVGANSPEQILANKWSDAVVAFARTGSPNTPDIPEWPLYDEATKSVMWFGNDVTLRNDPYPWLPEFSAALKAR